MAWWGKNDEEGTIADSHTIGSVSAGNSDDVGGLVGSNAGEIINSHALGEIDAAQVAGGLVGSNAGIIETSYASGNVTCSLICGGLAGEMSVVEGEIAAKISDAYATGAVNNNPVSNFDIFDYTGGLIGGLWSGDLERAYSAGNVDEDSPDEGDKVGGLFGIAEEGEYSVEEIYWDSTISGWVYPAGNESFISGTSSKMTYEFSDEGTFSGWDFDNVWTIGEAPDGEMRPIFQWQ